MICYLSITLLVVTSFVDLIRIAQGCLFQLEGVKVKEINLFVGVNFVS